MSFAATIARPRAGLLVCALAVTLVQASSASAQTTPGDPFISGAAIAPTGASPTSENGYLAGVWKRTNLLGDMGGVRAVLGDYGISLGLQETSEVLGNVTGGARKGWIYDGVTLLSIGVDSAKAFGWDNGVFNMSLLQIHGGNLSGQDLFNLQTASGITASPSTRLWELWYQHTLFEGSVDLKFGQQSIDQEFLTSAGASLFVNTALGWPVASSANLYASGPTYPLSSLGVRLRGRPTERLTLLAGVFQDNPPGGPFNDDSQLRGATRWGGNFNLRTGALLIAEAQYALNQPANGDMVDATEPAGLPGTYKLGGWFDTARFNNQRFDSAGRSLADPASSGIGGQLRSNFSLYAVIDQSIWRPDPAGPRLVNVFLRAEGAPSDRNVIEFGFNAGITVKALLPGREDDTFGIGYGLAKVSGAAVGLDRDIAFYSSAPYPKRSSESFIEATYQIQVNPWWQIQPDFQYVFLPGGGIPNPNLPHQRIGNEAIFGVRTNITF